MKKFLFTSKGCLLWIICVALFTSHSYGKTINYSYDEYSQLKAAQYEDQTTISYEYDSIGNRLTREINVIATDLSVEVKTGSGTPLADLKVYAFKDSGAYTGISSTTDEAGKAAFSPGDFHQGSYRFRVDYLGHQFWSGYISLPALRNLQVIIEKESTEIAVTVGEGVVEGITVYLFSESGSYLGLNGMTDSEGKVNFDLPSGCSFKFRADFLGNKYWSEAVEIASGTQAPVPIATGGGTLHITFQKDEEHPLADYKLYLFSSSGAYLGHSAVSDENGQVAFGVSGGAYKIRGDYLGYPFWTAPITVDGNQSHDLTLPHREVHFRVQGNFNGDVEPRHGLKSYLFSSTDTYLGIQKETDENGAALFSLPEQEYRIRSDYLSQQFWTEPFTWSDKVISINEGLADITVTNMGDPLEGVSVHLFSQSNSYLGISAETDENGNVSFRLPQGTYNFRADYMGSQYWSGASAVIEHVENPIALSTGGGNLSLSVLKDDATPLANLTCHLFSEGGAYLSKKGATNEEGLVQFNLADGIYKIRLDHLGYQFWSRTFQIPQESALTVTIPHQDITLSVQGDFNGDIQPREGLKTYLFSLLGSYLNQNGVTDSQGKVVYNLPEKEYLFRIDHLSQEFWSDTVLFEDSSVTLQEGIAQISVKQNQSPLSNVKVYLFSESGSYLNRHEFTDASGIAEFRLPQGIYKFRADYMGSQYWGTQSIAAHEVTSVEISTGGGRFALTVEKAPEEPLPSTSVYVFNGTGNYLNLSGQTGDQGTVSFDLSDGEFSFRADYMGYQFWTDTVSVPEALSATLTIPHQDVTVTVNQVYGAVNTPIPSCKVYLFKASGSYLGLSGETDAQGQIRFNVPFEAYMARADLMGRQYWTDAMIWSDQSVSINYGSIRLHVTQNDMAVENATVYLFSETDSYLGKSVITGEAGMANFFIPEGIYKFRVDYNATQYWSEPLPVSPHVENMIDFPCSQ